MNWNMVCLETNFLKNDNLCHKSQIFSEMKTPVILASECLAKALGLVSHRNNNCYPKILLPNSALPLVAPAFFAAAGFLGTALL